MLFSGTAAWSQMPCSIPPCASSSGQGRGSMPGRESPSTMPGINDTGPGPSMSPQLEQDQAKLRNKDRQKQLVADTQKLLALATELKTDVDKSNKDTLSMDVIKKADEIEKLAHSVKERMKG